MILNVCVINGSSCVNGSLMAFTSCYAYGGSLLG